MFPPIFYDIRIFEMFFVSFKIFFAHFVRNRLFSSRSFTDRRPIFINVSVTGSNFAKCSALINQRAKLSVKFTAKLFWIEGNRPACEKNGLYLQSIANNNPFFQYDGFCS